MGTPFFREREIRSDYQVINAAGITVATFGAPDLAFGFIADEDGRRGPLHVESVTLVERRQAVRRLKIARAA